jgi:hypothetical protein
MKKRVLYVLLFAIGIVMSINACTKKSDEVTPSDNINNYFSNQRAQTQKFTINANNNNIITGTKGTKVYIGGGTLRTISGQMVTGNVTLELKEIVKFSDMVSNNAPTVSKGSLLKSGGEFYISANQNGAPLTLADNANYFIEIAAPAGTSDSMKVFTGSDSSGVITWSPVETDTVNNHILLPDTTANILPGYDSVGYFNYNQTAWAIMNNAYSYFVKCMSFGWINADYFIEMQYADLCEQTVICDPSQQMINSQTRVYYIIPTSNSCATLYQNDSGFTFIGGIPNKKNIKIVALSYKDAKCYISVMDHFVNCEDTKTVVLNFKEIQEADIATALEKINM